MHLQEQKHKGEVWRDQQETCEICEERTGESGHGQIGKGVFKSGEERLHFEMRVLGSHGGLR